MSHDSVGNVVSTTLQSATNSSAKVITSSAVFTSSGNLQSSVTDSAGAVTSYAYETARNIAWGAPSKVTDAKGTETAYTFDNFGRYENITVDNGAGLTYNYSNGKLSQIQRKADGQTTLAYHFVYDDFGNTEQIKVGNKLLASYEYAAQNGMLLSQSYGNQDSVSFTYDNLGRAKTTTYSSGRVLSYIYTGDGQLYSVHDSATGYTYIYTYDSLGRLIASRVEDSSSQELMRTKLWYNASNQITKQTWTIGDTTYQETYAYNTGDATLSSYQNALGQTVSLGYDFLRRLSTVTAGDIYTQTYTYRDIDDSKTTTQVSGLAYSGFANAPSYGYTYDVLGNIATYTENGTAYAYTYDDLNQLLTATGGGKTYAYTYDLGGNILTATDGTATHTYTYGDANWADLLTAYDGESITYDGSGNPLSYYNGTRYTFTWEEGRRLATASGNGHNTSYAYDSNGLRLSKTVDGVVHNYFYASGKLLRETYGDTTLDFLYDNHGSPYALTYTAGTTTATYYYITNLQGDVLGLIDGSGNTVATYTYDPYGKVLSASGSMADINPLRYRGYYFDQESQLYYLQSRYYDPTLCRFLNADAYASTGQGIIGHNMFAYCLNNPSNMADFTGYCCIFLGIRIYDCKKASCPDSKSYMDTSGKTPGTTMGKTINGQGKLPYSNKRIGLGSYGANGCGLIAIYNAMTLIGKNVTLQDVTDDLRNYMLWFGLGGLKPSGLNFYFTFHNIKYKQISSISSLSSSVEEGSVFVFVVMNNKKDIFEGFHTMAGQYINGEYRIYNRYNNRTSYAPYASLKDGFREEVWIYGILLEP